VSDAPPASADRARGLSFAIAAYAAWGVIPLYWRQLGRISAVEILAYRVVWSLVFLGALALAMGTRDELLRALRDGRTRRLLAASSLFIGLNWGLFILSIQMNRLSEASLGYFINPLVNVALGVILFRETLRPLHRASIGLALAGVVILIAISNTLPWIALVLAASFAAYGLLRKVAPVPAAVGLLVETLALAPAALAYVAWLTYSRAGSVDHSARTFALTALSGPVTALPLVWFARAARALPFSTLGIVQFLSPTLQFLIAVFVFHEPMAPARWAAFACIWAALGLFCVDLARAKRA
jgi:chloramphenicol-sensitive protein RarD